MNCNGLHCSGCGGGKGPGIAVVVVVLAVALIAANGKAIGRAAAELGHVLVLVAIAGVGVTLAGCTVAALVMLRRRIHRAELAALEARETVARIDTAACRVQTAACRVQGVDSGPAPRALPAPRPDLPARVRIRPAGARERVTR